jgi:Na+-translocating ferredoxin:NAD+ oxidoreductase RnfA subunit
MNEIALCAIVGAFLLNLVFHTGLGMKEIHRGIDSFLLGPLLRWVSLGIVVFLFWLLWTFVFSPLSLGFFDVVFIFPFCALTFYVIDEYLLKHKSPANKYDNALFLSTPLCVFSLFMTLRLASSVAEAAVLSLSFSIGCILSALTLNSIYLRVQSEPISKRIVGLPFIFITSGLLAFIFSIVATILL